MNNIRFYITENCNAKCSNCFNWKLRDNRTMSVDRFKELCSFFSSNKFSHLKVMGGEPTLHPDFEKVMAIAQNYFPRVSLFTNGINQFVEKFHPRDADSIIYNFRFNKALTPAKLLLTESGTRALEIQIHKNTDCQILLNDIYRVTSFDINRLQVYFTLDCTSRIFDEKDIVVSKYEFIWNECKNKNIRLGQDHLIPFCYLLGTKIPMPRSGAMCHIDCAGLVDAKYQLRFCNQYSKVLSSMFQDDSIISIFEYQKLLENQMMIIKENRKQNVCGDCPYWEKICNGGCFISKDIC